MKHKVRQKRYANAFLPLYPAAFAGCDLGAYDLVLSSASSFAKFVRPAPGIPHLCYCHSPTRFLWRAATYQASYPRGTRPLVRALLPVLRRLDYRAAHHVKRRRARGNHREAIGIYESSGEIAECDARLTRTGFGSERVPGSLERAGDRETKERDLRTKGGKRRHDAFVRLHSGRAPRSGVRFARCS